MNLVSECSHYHARATSYIIIDSIQGMKRTLLLAAALLIYGLLMAQDSLVRGGFVEYTYLGNKSYEAKLSLYVSCPYPNLSLYIGCQVGSDTLSGDSLTFVQESDITGIPSTCTTQSRCSGDTSALYGVKRMVWTRKFDLDTFSHCDVLFFAYAGKRHSGITTGSAGQIFYIDSWLNQCTSLGSSSPKLLETTENGLLFYNQDHGLNYGAFGSGDFDSVSYAMTPGRIAPGASINYSGIYSPTKPICYFGICSGYGWPPCSNLNWPAGFHLDPITGQILFRPTGLCFGPLAVEMTLWKRDSSGMQVASKFYREQAVEVIASTGNKLPKINPPYSKQACVGQKNCFYIQTDDDDASDSVFLNIESDIPGLNIQINHSQSRLATAEVCWTPDSSFISNVPYTFLVKAKDNHCDLRGANTRSFSIFVRETPKAQTSIRLENCGRVILSAIPEKNYQYVFQVWTIKDSLGNQVAITNQATDTFLLKPGKYKTVHTLQTATPCYESYYDSFEIADYNQVKILSGDLYCFGDSIRAAVSNTESHSFTYTWSNHLSDTLNTTNSAIVNYHADTSHYLHVTAKWGAYCETSDSLFIGVVHPHQELAINYPAYCIGDSTTLKVLQPYDSLAYQWSTGDTSDSIRVSSPGWYELLTTYFTGCQQVDSIEVVANPLPNIQFVAPDTICFGDTITVSANVSGTNPIQFLWQDSSIMSSVQSAGGELRLQVMDGNGCVSMDSLFIANYAVPVPDSNYFEVCSGQGFHLFAHDSSGLIVHYSFGDTGNYVIPKISERTTVEVITDKQCKSTFPIQIVVNELPDPSFTFSTINERNLLFIPVNQWNAYHYWDFGDSTTSSQMIVNHDFSSNGPHEVSLIVTDRSTACMGTAKQIVSFNVGLNGHLENKIQVFPNPFGHSFQISSQETARYRIYSPLGSMIQKGELEVGSPKLILSSEWEPGVYLIYIESDNTFYSLKVVHQ